MKVIRSYSVRVNEFIFRLLSEKLKPRELYDASRHLIKAGGKRVRPFLVIQSCRAVGGREDSVLPAAVAVELIHNFTLIHDDIMDQDELRRGAPTVHVLWGVSTAILAGDLLFSKAFEALFMCSSHPDISSEGLVEAGRRLASAVSVIAEGQALDMSFSGRLRSSLISEDDYFEMIYKKTAALFKVSCEIGGILGGANSIELEALSKYGEHIGIAFQMKDDVLGIVGDESVLGKPIGSDLREGKCTLILIHALRNASEGQRRIIMDVYGKENISREEIRRVIDVLDDLGSIEYVEDIARRRVVLAKDSLKVLPSSEAKSLLLDLADFIVARRY